MPAFDGRFTFHNISEFLPLAQPTQRHKSVTAEHHISHEVRKDVCIQTHLYRGKRFEVPIGSRRQAHYVTYFAVITSTLDDYYATKR